MLEITVPRLQRGRYVPLTQCYVVLPHRDERGRTVGYRLSREDGGVWTHYDVDASFGGGPSCWTV